MRRAMRGSLPDEILRRGKSPLAQEPFSLHLKNKSWHPSRVPYLASELAEYVDWQEFLRKWESQQNATFQEQWGSVPPVALNFWLTVGKSR